MSNFFNPPESNNGASPVLHCQPAPGVHTTHVEASLPSQESIHQPSSKGAEVPKKISRTFDPEVELHCEADHASSMF